MENPETRARSAAAQKTGARSAEDGARTMRIVGLPNKLNRDLYGRPELSFFCFLSISDIFFMDFTPQFGISAIILEKEARFFAN